MSGQHVADAAKSKPTAGRSRYPRNIELVWSPSLCCCFCSSAAAAFARAWKMAAFALVINAADRADYAANLERISYLALQPRMPLHRAISRGA